MIKQLSIALIALAAACTTEKPATTDTAANVSREGEQPAPADSIATPAPKETRDSVLPLAPSKEEPAAGQWDVTSKGIGRLPSGTRIQDAHLLLGTTIPIPADLSCTYVKPKNAPAGVALMVVDGNFVRVDVTSGSAKTIEGARIGSTESEINSLYKGRVATQPAKYGNGHTLVVTPTDKSNTRIVFETDGKKVTRFRSGQLPQVEWVESCG
jgi:hypothetical protein